MPPLGIGPHHIPPGWHVRIPLYGILRRFRSWYLCTPLVLWWLSPNGYTWIGGGGQSPQFTLEGPSVFYPRQQGDLPSSTRLMPMGGGCLLATPNISLAPPQDIPTQQRSGYTSPLRPYHPLLLVRQHLLDDAPPPWNVIMLCQRVPLQWPTSTDKIMSWRGTWHIFTG